MRKQDGFTLIELIIVIIILGILAVTAAPKFLNLQGDARQSAAQGLAGAINSAAQLVRGKKSVNSAYNDVVTGANNFPALGLNGIYAAVDLDKSEWSYNETTNLFLALDDHNCTISYAPSTGVAVVTPTGCTD